VLHIGKFFAPFKGGVETYLHDAMQALQAEGVQCAALVHNHQRSLRARHEQAGAPGQAIPLVRAGTWVRAFFTPISPGFRGCLKRLVEDFKPDVIHVHLPNPSSFWVLSLASARAVPLVVHWHSDVITKDLGGVMRFLYTLYRPFERALLSRAAAIIATSESYLASSESLADFPGKCRVIPLGLDTSLFAGLAGPARREPSSPRPLQVLSIGRLTYYKGFGYLVRAVARLTGVQLHIVGDGELREELEGLARQVGAGDRVVFHGALDDQQLAERLHDCDCVCLASIERTEAFGLVLLEAMYFGRAAVVTRVAGSGMAWVVQDRVTGLVVPPADIAALAMALAQLRDDPALLEQLGANGRQRFDQLFKIEYSARALSDTYIQALAAPAGTHSA
jgi:rhamnosyl/mannosyltransferase